MAEFLRNAEKAIIRAQNTKDNDLAYACEVAWAEYYWHAYLKLQGGKFIRAQVSEFHDLLKNRETGRALKILSSVSKKQVGEPV
jgi:hypothetical protein